MFRQTVHLGQTQATLLADSQSAIDVGVNEIKRQRKAVEDTLASMPEFLTSLVPVPPRHDTPPIAQRMCETTVIANVGPMAAVAGAIAHFAVQAMKDAGANLAVVDNGGDIALWLDRPLVVGIFTGPSSIRDLAFQVEPRETIFGICTSSGTVGHSLSFGRADAAVVVAHDAILADAVATAFGNALKEDSREALEIAMKQHQFPGVLGLLAIMNQSMAAWGQLPQLIETSVPLDLISRG